MMSNAIERMRTGDSLGEGLYDYARMCNSLGVDSIMSNAIDLISVKALANDQDFVTCLGKDGGYIFTKDSLFAELKIITNLYEIVSSEEAALRPPLWTWRK
jgi:hypothetical protein